MPENANSRAGSGNTSGVAWGHKSREGPGRDSEGLREVTVVMLPYLDCGHVCAGGHTHPEFSNCTLETWAVH